MGCPFFYFEAKLLGVMKVKFIATADWHIHEFSDFSKIINVVWSNQSKRFIELDVPEAKPMNSRLFNILNGLCDIRDYATQHYITHQCWRCFS